MGRELSPELRERRRNRILETATNVFLEHGYAGSTMSMVAQRLGGSKATLYAYFASKEELCEGIIQRVCGQAVGAIEDAGAMLTIEKRLMHIGMAFMRLAVCDAGVKSTQLAIEFARRNPELAERFEAVGHGAVAARLAEFIGEANARGEIRVPDPLGASKIFLSLMRGDLHFLRLLNRIPAPDAERQRAEVAGAIGVFMAAFAPQPSDT